MADPVSIFAGVSAIGSLFSAFGAKPSGATPAAPPDTPAPATDPQGSPSSTRPTATPSFLASASAPVAGNTGGQKTLLGQ